MPSPVNTTIGSYFTAPTCHRCHLVTTKIRCPVCQCKTRPHTLEKVTPDLAESDTGQAYSIWPFERMNTGRYSGPRRPGIRDHLPPLETPPENETGPLLARIRNKSRPNDRDRDRDLDRDRDRNQQD